MICAGMSKSPKSSPKTSPFLQIRNQGIRRKHCASIDEREETEEATTVFKGDVILGVRLASESFAYDRSADVVLGTVVLESEDVPATWLRKQLREQLPSLPSRFGFLTKEGWPITPQQEQSIRIFALPDESRTVRIRHLYDKPRIGIRKANESFVGFVFAEHNSKLSQLRSCIDEQIASHRHRHVPSTQVYQFVDQNTWPISTEQESQLTVLDVLNGASVCIREYGSENFPNNVRETSPEERRGLQPEPNNKTSLSRGLTFRSGKDAARSSAGGEPCQSCDDDGKEILISYVRAEAAHHAVCLKEELSALGFSVYLDVDEIKTGVDWQDALNYAVSNCEVLVPLVTPHYGETQWTNREVKLADVLGKSVIPVSFVKKWPPRCLAIQFATTQFIPWKTQEEIDLAIKRGIEDAIDIKMWDKRYVRSVARELGELVRNDGQRNQTRLRDSSKRVSMLRSYPAFLPDMVDGPLEVMEPREGKPLIVVGLHPDQNMFGITLKFLLEGQGYEVWLSTPVDEVDDSQLPPSKMTRSVSADYRGLIHPLLKFTPSCTNVQRDFQSRADQAGIVLFVLSAAFAESKVSKGQVFYCEHRKYVIPIKYEEFDMPGWMNMLIGRKRYEDARQENFKELLSCRIKRALDPSARVSETYEINEAKLAFNSRFLKQTIDVEVGIENCVYIFGSVSPRSQRSKEFCRILGQNLAGIEVIGVATGGEFGVSELVAESFIETRKKMKKLADVWHVLPEREPQNCSQKARQNPDLTFQVVPYGNTVFSGENFEERESIVARVFEIAILIEGELDVAHGCVEFLWNDHLIIPIRCTGGAAAGSFGVPTKIFEIPAGVKEADWQLLSDNSASTAAVARATVNVIKDLQLTLHDYERIQMAPSQPRLRNRSVRQRISKARLQSMNTLLLDE
ncbi:PREDICTED: uncharacterized protein LOC106805611 isoform X2 [Priapulus caudatus]|uniref:Uncharacterized protein LOC106805611 isoform X2 n=1 Tax=Priapulus caudatus TaxID=37621 RepID=A0ABM1DS58_PRICU|nr:PREDICTED: uncharacterized protein LOC106805611 isoform X2 [Priapulus caudatus]